MLIQSPVLKIIEAILAVIGAVAVFAVIGMFIMHGTMMHTMGSSSRMATMCQSMMNSTK